MKPLPSPRPVPTHVGFGVPHGELHDACRRFWRDLLRAESDGEREAEAIRRKFGIDYDYSQTWDMEIYASAVHIFAAMTVEAVMNVFAVVRFGEEPFNEHFRYGNPIQRLRKILHYKQGIDLGDESEIVAIMRRLFDVRDALVHSQSSENHYDENGRPLRERKHLVVTKESAAKAMSDLDRFIELIAGFDDELESFVRTW